MHLVIAVATAVTYGIVLGAVKKRDLEHLETYVRERARQEEIAFQQVQSNLKLVRLLSHSRSEPMSLGAIAFGLLR